MICTALGAVNIAAHVGSIWAFLDASTSRKNHSPCDQRQNKVASVGGLILIRLIWPNTELVHRALRQSASIGCARIKRSDRSALPAEDRFKLGNGGAGIGRAGSRRLPQAMCGPID
jgi:hypothetical protein